MPTPEINLFPPKPRKPIPIGTVFHRLTVMSLPYKQGRFWFVDTRCSCGNSYKAKTQAIKSGNTKSCGCFAIERRYQVKARLSHGKKYSRVYVKWGGMLSRCRNPNASQYEKYGGRGITVCERWSTFENFYADMGDPPPRHSIERIDVNGNYEPGNCRWATDKEQANNRRNTRFYEVGGQRMTISDVAAQAGMPAQIIAGRMTSGWTIERAISTPIVPRPWRRKIR